MKNLPAKKKWLVILGILGVFALQANHLVGGKISYRHLGSNKFEITLTVYRDCNTAVPFDDPASITIFDKGSLAVVSTLSLSLTSTTIIPVNAPNPCYAPSYSICVEVGTYVTTVILPQSATGFILAYQRCCRNISVANLVNPTTVGTTITTEIPPQTNSSPNFINFPPVYVCLSDTFNYSFACTDADGDQLVYQLCDPLDGGSTNVPAPSPATAPPYNSAPWAFGYSATNPIPNNGGISLNSATGQLKFKPIQLGQFAIVICVQEFRNNVLINTSRLELQFNVVICHFVSSIPMSTNICDGLTINFQNASTNANSFYWNFGDLTALNDTSNAYTPSYTYPAYGTYTVTLVAKNTNYPYCKDTARKVINVSPLLAPTLQPVYAGCFKNNQFSFNVGGVYHPSATFSWHFPAGITLPVGNTNPVSTGFTSADTASISVDIEQYGCKATLYASVSFSNPVAGLNDSLLNCNTNKLTFINTSTGASNYSWNFGVPSVPNSTLTNPSYTYATYGNYTVTLIAYKGVCTDTLKKMVRVFPLLALNPVSTPPEQCFKYNTFNFLANGVYGNGVSFNWQIGANSSFTQSTAENPSNIHFTHPGTYPVVLEIQENGCSRKRSTTVKVNPSPGNNVFVSDTLACEPKSILFQSKSDNLQHIQMVNWTIQNNSFSDTLIRQTFSAGIYSYSVIVTNNFNCSDTLIKKDRILIHPKPKVKSLVSPMYTSILYPSVNFIDSTRYEHTTRFNFGDGTSSQQVYNTHNYEAPGNFEYSLIVSNEYSCADTAIGMVVVDDIGDGYIPNIFTPNNDDINDWFFIRGESITHSEMIIYNRWGARVFITDNALKGWDGTSMESGMQADEGAYLYVINVTLFGKRNYTFKGAVELQR